MNFFVYVCWLKEMSRRQKQGYKRKDQGRAVNTWDGSFWMQCLQGLIHFQFLLFLRCRLLFKGLSEKRVSHKYQSSTQRKLNNHYDDHKFWHFCRDSYLQNCYGWNSNFEMVDLLEPPLLPSLPPSPPAPPPPLYPSLWSKFQNLIRAGDHPIQCSLKGIYAQCSPPIETICIHTLSCLNNLVKNTIWDGGSTAP